MKWLLRTFAFRHRLARLGFIALLLTVALFGTALAQSSPVNESTDLKMELRSATGSNRFRLGEVIPVELLISSTTPNHYLEPCAVFWEGCFGYPQCRFFTRWSFDVLPATGWTDIGGHGCQAMSGPTIEIKSSDLTLEPKKYAYTLTKRFRFDTPGKYTVRLSLTVGLDDETNKLNMQENPGGTHNSVSKTAEIVLEIMPAGDAWKKTALEQGVAAWTAKPPAYTNPPSQEFLENQREKELFCNLGTPEAVVASVRLLSRGFDTRHCITINANKEAAETEMRRLLVDPDVGVTAMYFAEYTSLAREHDSKPGSFQIASPDVVNGTRNILFASLPKKTPEAMILSLETVLMNPMSGYVVGHESAYDLRAPYSTEVIAMAAANFDRLSEVDRAKLLDREWDHVRSPLMLPVVRREAEKGNGQALLRWQELEPATATAFMRSEVTRPAPRFSSLYLRLPDESLPAQEQQIAANFVALSTPRELIFEATLLHRYATRTTLPTVLPFIDQHLSEWSCEVQIPVLAYLLKVSPDDARTRVDKVLNTVRPPYCPRGEFLPDLGFMQASPVLDSVAAKLLKERTPLTEDAAAYLRKYGSAAMKPLVWTQLSYWHQKYVESGGPLRMGHGPMRQDDNSFYNLDSRLRETYIDAHGWILSPDDVRNLSKLMGDKQTEEMACAFSCGSQLSVGPGPGNYSIYGRVNDPIYPPQSRIDYLMPTEPFQYQINQYGCRDLQSLEEKLLQFPAGSMFSFAYTGSGQDVGDWAAISAFLRSHGYMVGN